jgi:hypothetical protein
MLRRNRLGRLSVFKLRMRTVEILEQTTAEDEFEVGEWEHVFGLIIIYIIWVFWFWFRDMDPERLRIRIPFRNILLNVELWT